MFKEYIVRKRTAQWWVICEGEGFGPYISQKVAEDAATAMAKVDFTAGTPARVSVDEDEGAIRTIYDSAAS